MLRAKLTQRQWARIRKMAIDERMHSSELVGELITKGLECRAAEREESK